MEKLRKEKSKQIKSAYKFFDIRQETIQIKSQGSQFTMIQKPQEKYAKVYEMLGRPLIIHRKNKSTSLKADIAQTNSTKSIISTSNQSKNKFEQNNNNKLKNSFAFIRKITENSNNHDSEENFKTTGKKSLRSMIEIQDNCVPPKIKSSQNLNPTLQISFKKKIEKQITLQPPPELTGFKIDEFFENSYLMVEKEKSGAKSEFELADEAIKNFFAQKETLAPPKIEQNIDSLNTIKSSGEIEEENKSSVNMNMKESFRFDTSSRLRMTETETIGKDLPSSQIKMSYQPFKFELEINERNLKAAKFIQKRWRIFLRSKQKKGELEKNSPELKSPSPTVQRKFKKFSTLSNIQSPFHNFSKEQDNFRISIRNQGNDRQSVNTSPQRRHKSHVFNLNQLAIKRRQIKITIHKDFMIFLNQKTDSPKINISKRTNLSNLSIEKKNIITKLFDYKNNKSHLNQESEKSLEGFLDDIDSHHLLSPSKEIDEKDAKEGANISPKSFHNLISSFEIKDSLREVGESSNNLSKSSKAKINIATVNNMKHMLKEYKSHIDENKKKIINKTDFNQLNYAPFFFTKFFAGKLRKFRVKYYKFQGKDQEKKIIFYLQTSRWNYKFECPVTKNIKMKAFRDYRTIWPLVFQPFYDWMQSNNFITEEDFKSEHKFMSDKMRAKFSFFDRSYQNKNHLTETTNDLKACGDIKILLEILLSNYFTMSSKLNGDTLKFIGLNLADIVVHSYSYILFEIRKFHQELKRLNFMGIYYEKICQKNLIEEFKNPKSIINIFFLTNFFIKSLQKISTNLFS